MDLYGDMLSSELCTLIKEFFNTKESPFGLQKGLSFLEQEHNEGEK